MRAKIINRTDFRTNDLLKACDRFWSSDYWRNNRAKICVIVAYDGDDGTEAEAVANTLGAQRTYTLFLPRNCNKAEFARRAQLLAPGVSNYVVYRFTESPRYQLRPKPDKDERTAEQLANLEQKARDLGYRVKRCEEYASWYSGDESWYGKKHRARAAQARTELEKVQARLDKLKKSEAA